MMMLTASVNIASMANEKNVTVEYGSGNVIWLTRYDKGTIQTSGEGTLYENIQEAITLIKDMD